MTIPYQIESIKTLQFAIFPDKFVNVKAVNVHTSFNFAISKTLDHIRCISNVTYDQDDNLLLTTEVQCIFKIAPEGTEAIRKEKKLSASFLRYMATIVTGTVRGILSVKTEGTVLNPIVLPPTNLVEIIKDDMNVKVEEV